jgi:hypothetical protein
MATKLETWADNIVEQVLEGEMSLNEGIEKFDERMKGYEVLKTRRDRLLSARRSLLGVGSRTTSSGGRSLTQDEVAKAMGEQDGGMSVAQIATKTGGTEGAVRGHLNRARRERFLKQESTGLWFLRDPENDLNTEDDLE